MIYKESMTPRERENTAEETLFKRSCIGGRNIKGTRDAC